MVQCSWVYNYLWKYCLMFSGDIAWYHVADLTFSYKRIASCFECGVYSIHQYGIEFKLFSHFTLVFSTNKTDLHKIPEILLKIAFITLALTPILWVRLPEVMRCTWYICMWHSLTVLLGKSVMLSVYNGIRLQ
jgi:hypothetical protein